MNERAQRLARWAAALGLVVATAGAGAQTTGGQSQAAQSLAAQTRPSPANTAVAAVPVAAPAQVPPAAPTGQPATSSRRDPFRPLVIKGKGDEIPARLPPGKAGLVIGQLTVQGIVRGIAGQWIAVVDNKTKRAYFLYAGDELFNGAVSRITEDSVVFQERLTDPMGRQLTREVVKQLALR